MAWIVLDRTGQEVRCDGYIKGKDAMTGPILPVVSAATCVIPKDDDPFIMIVNQACYNSDEEQNESLCLPFQAEQHGVTFDLTPRHRLNASGENGKQMMRIEDREIPLEFDGLKMYLNIRCPTNDEMDELPILELTSDRPFIPDSNEDHDNVVTHRRKEIKEKKAEYPGGISMLEWRKRMAFAPNDILEKTFMATTQLAMNVEAENRLCGRRHYKSRFNFLKEKRINDIFHSDTFFPTVKSNSGDTCSQIFIGKKTDFMKVYPMKKESHSFRALQDFSRNVGLPVGIKTDNATTETGQKWTNFCRDYKVDTTYTEPRSPWQNYAEHGIGDLGRMVKRCMEAFNVPLDRHHWCQRWCCDVRNHLASRKLDWRTPQEKISGETPDISVFRFHFWQKVEYYEPMIKQPQSGWLPARFLGIAWDSGDHMTYYIESRSATNRPIVIVRSTIRAESPLLRLEADPSGETIHGTTLQENNEPVTRNSNDGEAQHYERAGPEVEQAPTTINNHDDEDIIGPNRWVTEEEPTVYDPNDPHTNQMNDMGRNDDIELTSDDAYVQEGPINDHDDACLNEEITNDLEDTNEDFEFHHIQSHKWSDGILVFNVVLQSGQNFDIPFNIIKKDRPLETAKYIRSNVVEKKRNGKYNNWAMGIIKQSIRTVRRLSRLYNVDRIMRLRKNADVVMKIRRLSKNTRDKNIKNKEKFGVKVPNNVRDALILDRINKNTLWADAMTKEMSALNSAKCFLYYPPDYKFGSEFQYAPLRMIFDVKKEDLRRKARLVAGGHVINSTMFESYSSVVQTKSLRLLLTIAINQNLGIITADIGNAFIQAETKEKIWTRCGPEFGERSGCVAMIKKALYGLSTSARQWSLELGDTLKSFGFEPTRADPDLWFKRAQNGKYYEYIASHVDDIIIVSKDPTKYVKMLEKIYPLRNVERDPDFYLGNNIKRETAGRMKISLEKYVNEIVRKFELKHGTLRKENVPYHPNDHPELDDTPLLNSEGITDYQSIIGVCQWISISSRMDITFAVSSLSRFAAKPQEGHLRRALKIIGYLKKYPKRGYVIDPRPPIENIKFSKVTADFGNQYDAKEELDSQLPEPLMDELVTTIFVDSNHGHDLLTGKSITGVIVFVGRTPIKYFSKRQSTVQTSTFGAEFISLKRAVEEAITIRYYLRSMGVKISKPTIVYGDNMSSIKNTIDPGSPLKKKYLALAYHFCREHFSTGIVDIRKIDTKHNISDPFTKGLATNDFHTHFNSFMSN